MYRKILSASVLPEQDAPVLQIRPSPGINILCGEHARDVFWALVGITDVCPAEKRLRSGMSVRAEIHWPDGIIYGIFGEVYDDKQRMMVEYMRNHSAADRWYLEKRFHKQRFRDVQEDHCFFNGNQPEILDAFYVFINAVSMQKNGRPLFLCNFLERLDRNVDLQPVFHALQRTGRQVFIAVPPRYDSKDWAYAATCCDICG